MKLIDFNTAVKTDSKTYKKDIKGSTGLKEWSGPETRSKLYYSAKCDVWSCGHLIYYMIAGQILSVEQS